MKKLILAVVILAVIGFGASYLLRDNKTGAIVETRLLTFTKGLKVGSPATQVIDSSGNWDGAVTGTTGSFSGDVRVSNLTHTGSVALGTGATTSISAADACNYPIVTVSPITAGSSTTLPTGTAFSADCATTAFDGVRFKIINIATTAASTTIVKAADASTTLLMAQATGTSTVTLSGGEAMIVEIVRDGSDSTKNRVFLTEYTNQ